MPSKSKEPPRRKEQGVIPMLDLRGMRAQRRDGPERRWWLVRVLWWGLACLGLGYNGWLGDVQRRRGAVSDTDPNDS
jgi:hypothetical protein